MYWDHNLECMPGKELNHLKLKRLNCTIRRVFERVPFYRERLSIAGIGMNGVESLEELRNLPFTTRDDLRDYYPFGLLATSKEDVIRVHTSTGTTGKPKAILFTRNDIDQASGLIARCLVMIGLGCEDILQNMMSYGLFTGGLIMHYGAEKVGVLVIPAGAGSTERQIELMMDFGTTAIHITPSFALYLADVFSERGIDPRRELSLRLAFVGAEPSSEETRKKLEILYGIKVYNSYGLSEMNGPGVGFECPEKRGMHIWEDHFITEIVDPDTGEPLSEGEEGELVFTTLAREAMPILRYRSGDITRIIPGDCPCGRTHLRIDQIRGRSDDMFIVKGVNIFPQQVEQVLMGLKEVANNYQILLEREKGRDRMVVRVEIEGSFFGGTVDYITCLKREIASCLHEKTLITPEIELLEPGTLPTSVGKSKRVIDNREI